MERMALRDQQEHQEVRDQQDQPVQRGHLVLLGRLVLQDLREHRRIVQEPVRLDRQEVLVLLDLRERLELMEQMEHRDQRDLQALRELMEQTVHLDHQAPLDCLD